MIQAHAAMALLSGVTHPLVTPTIASKNAFPLAAGWLVFEKLQDSRVL